MQRRTPPTETRRERKQPLVESLCRRMLAVQGPSGQLGLRDLLALEDAISKFSKPSVWNAVSEESLPGLFIIYITSIRRSSPLLGEPCSATEAQHHASVRGALSKQLLSLKPQRAPRLGLAILRAQSLRCYAILLADAAERLARHHGGKRNEDAADELLSDLSGLACPLGAVVKGKAEADAAPPPEVLRTFQEELTESSVLEHWARLLLTLASCEGNERALKLAVAHMASFSVIVHGFLKHFDPSCAHRLLASSPCLSYLLTSQLVALCAELDGGSVYGMPEAPGGVLLTTTVQFGGTKGRESLVERAVESCRDTFGLLSKAFEQQLQQGPHVAAGSDPASVGASVAGSARQAPAPQPAAAGEGQGAAPLATEAGMPAVEVGRVGEDAAAARRPGGSGQGVTAVAVTTAQAAARGNPRPLLLDPTVCLEVSLRLAVVLGCAVAGEAGSAQAQGGGDGSSGRLSLNTAFQAQLTQAVPRVALSAAANNALALARMLLNGAPSAVARLRQRGLRDSGSGGGGGGGTSAAAAPGAPRAPSPLERWWQGAAAVAGALTAAAEHFGEHGDKADEDLAWVVDAYFTLLEHIASGESREPPAQPSECVAAALSAGFLPCLERLLRAALPLELTYEWARALGDGWDALWAQMLAFAGFGQVAAVVDEAAENLRRAVAANKEDITNYHYWVEDAASVATRLCGGEARAWLHRLAADRSAGGSCSRPNVPDCGTADCGSGPSPGRGHPASGVLPRLAGSLSLIATRLLPELSRGLLGGLLPLFQRGDVELDEVSFLLSQLLAWVPTLAAATGEESVRQAVAAAGEGGAHGGGDTGSSDGVVVSGIAGGGGGTLSPRAQRWRQLLLVELRLPGLLGAALGLSRDQVAQGARKRVVNMRNTLRNALRALVILVPADLARTVAAADRAEAAAAGRAANAPFPPPPSSGLLRRALGPGGPLEDAELLAAVEAACAGGAGGGGQGSGRGAQSGAGLPPDMEELLCGARLLSLGG